LQLAAADTEPHDVLEAQRGDLDAFERLYRSHVGRVLALCARMTGDRAMAEDLTQETFVKAWERLATFKGESAFGSWLHRIAANVVLDAARARGRRLRRITPVEDAEAFADPTPSWDCASTVDLERAVAALPEGARTAFVLHDVNGFSHEEVARMSGQAVGTSKAQLHRARQLLREALR
jgi:RNA polymerase sigma-70 factor (ECF subfamily)